MDSQLNNCNKKIDRLLNDHVSTEDERKKALQVLKYGIEQDFQFDQYQIPYEVIDAFGNSIVVYPDYLEWNLNVNDLKFNASVAGTRRTPRVSLECPISRTEADISAERYRLCKMEKIVSLILFLKNCA